MVRVTRSRHQQKGMSAAGWLGVLAILGFFVVTFFRVFPMYYDHLKVQTALEGLKEDSSVDLASKRAVWNALVRDSQVSARSSTVIGSPDSSLAHCVSSAWKTYARAEASLACASAMPIWMRGMSR